MVKSNSGEHYNLRVSCFIVPSLYVRTIYMYLYTVIFKMYYQAIDQNIFPEVLRSAQCSIARSQRLKAIELWADLSTEGKYFLSIAWLHIE
jgi:hypothetical protein